MSPCTIGVLTPRPLEPTLDPPKSFPLGRAALRLVREGVRVVFGDELRSGAISGLEVVAGDWRRVDSEPIVAAYDRFPSRQEATQYRRIIEGLAGVPVANCPEAIRLCRDKLSLQNVVESQGISMPRVEVDPASFEIRLREWGAGFIKPRYGHGGHGIRRVVLGDSLPKMAEGGIAGVLEPVLLQEAVEPPSGWAGMSVRILAQRKPGGEWVTAPAVMRMSRTDPVVNATRGAEVAPAEDLVASETLAACYTLATKACTAIVETLNNQPVIELGIDLVIDEQARPHLIEVNGRPLGRLRVLAELDPARFEVEYRRVSERPLRYLASRYALTPQAGVIRSVLQPNQ